LDNGCEVEFYGLDANTTVWFHSIEAAELATRLVRAAIGNDVLVNEDGARGALAVAMLTTLSDPERDFQHA
jgi:hypothetical protein